MKNRQDGFAIIYILLFSLLTMFVIVTTVSITTIGSRKQTADGAQAEQAIVAADSGVSTYVARVKEGGFTGNIYDISCWTQGTPLGTTSCATPVSAHIGALQLDPSNAAGPSATVRLVALNVSESSITLQSVGRSSTASTAAQATLTQRVTLKKPPFLNISPPAALTTCPGITGGGNAKLYGVSTTTTPPPGIISNITTVTASSPSFVSPSMSTSSVTGWPATLTVTDATYLDAGSYVTLNAQPYVVTSKTSTTTLTVQPANPVSLPASGTLLTGTLNLIPIAARQGGTASGTTSGGKSVYTLPISDPTSVFIGDVMYINIVGVTYGVTVTNKGFVNGDLGQGYVNVTLGATGGGANIYSSAGTVLVSGGVPAPTAVQIALISPGTPMFRYVPSAMSAGSINGDTTPNDLVTSLGGSSTVSPAAIANSGTVLCGDNLFGEVFNNYTKTQFYNLTPNANRLSGVSSSTPLKGDIYWVGPVPTSPSSPSGASYTLGSSDLCGSGIIVINGDLSMNGTGSLNAALNQCTSSGDGVSPPGFNGLLYVIGNFTSKGNNFIQGSVVVEGNVNISSPNSQTSSSLGGGMNITYDPRTLLTSAKNLSPVTFALRSGTWSQQ